MRQSGCSKHYYRGHCEREVVFWIHVFGRRENACAQHLGAVLEELDPRTPVEVVMRKYASVPASSEREGQR